LGLENDVLVLVDLVALDDIGIVDLADTFHGLCVIDAFAARLVDLVEGELGAAVDRVIEFDGDRNETETKKPLPISATWTCHPTHSPFAKNPGDFVLACH